MFENIKDLLNKSQNRKHLSASDIPLEYKDGAINFEFFGGKERNVSIEYKGSMRNKFWIKDDNKNPLYIFKYHAKDGEDFAEVLYSKIAKSLDIPCNDCYLARARNTNPEATEKGKVLEGVLCRNYNDDFSKATVLHLSEQNDRFVVEKAIDKFKELESEGVKIDGDLEFRLGQMAILDYLLHNRDRRSGNIDFLERKTPNGKTIEMAKLYDNGYIFGVGSYAESEFPKLKKEVKGLKILNKRNNAEINFDNKLKVGAHTENSNSLITETLSKLFTENRMVCMADTISKQANKVSKQKDHIKEATTDLARFISKDKRLKDFYSSIDINIGETIEEIEQETGARCPDHIGEIASDLLSIKKDLLDRELEKINQKELEDDFCM